MRFQSNQGASVLRGGRTAAAYLAAVVAVSGCGGVQEPEVAKPGTVQGFAGVVAADEPRAAVVGREVLANNGNAVDAAVAMGFAMTVTMPSRVGLGGGGACVVHQRKRERRDALVFLPPVGANGAAVPLLARGLAALHARHGLTRWQALVRPAERLAGEGHEVSRAFRTDLVAGRDRLSGEARRTYLRDGETVPDVGTRIRQPALGAALAGLRQRGAGYFVTGDFVRRLSEGAQAAGVDLTTGDIRDAVPNVAEPLTAPFGEHTVYLPPEPVTAGRQAATAWTALASGSLGKADSAKRWRRLIGAWRTDGAAVSGGPAAPAGPSAGLAVADRFGNMVACGFTLNGLFGTGKMAGGTGILLAEAQPPAAAGRAVLPAILANRNTNVGYMALHSAGRRNVAAPLTQALATLRASGGVSRRPTGSRTVLSSGSAGNPDAKKVDRRKTPFVGPDGATVQALLHDPRAAPVIGTRVMRHEGGLPAAVLDTLRSAGYTLEQVPNLGTMTAVYCPDGARNAPAKCTGAADSRGHGMSVIAR